MAFSDPFGGGNSGSVLFAKRVYLVWDNGGKG